jgi:hypothetical protein
LHKKHDFGQRPASIPMWSQPSGGDALGHAMDQDLHQYLDDAESLESPNGR